MIQPDGAEVAVDLVYTGQRQGLDRWIAEYPVAHIPRGPHRIRVARPVNGSCVAVDVIDHVPPVLRR